MPEKNITDAMRSAAAAGKRQAELIRRAAEEGKASAKQAMNAAGAPGNSLKKNIEILQQKMIDLGYLDKLQPPKGGNENTSRDKWVSSVDGQWGNRSRNAAIHMWREMQESTHYRGEKDALCGKLLQAAIEQDPVLRKLVGEPAAKAIRELHDKDGRMVPGSFHKQASVKELAELAQKIKSDPKIKWDAAPPAPAPAVRP